jgi:hypothetical protein
MKPLASPFLFLRGRLLASLLLSLTATAEGFAQALAPVPATPVAKVDPAQTARDLEIYRAGVGSALAHAKSGNLVAAEAALTALNKAKPNTAAWHIETSQRLTQTAEQLARSGKPTNVSALANSALKHLVDAEALTTDVRKKATMKSLAGFIHERYLGNPTAAQASYRAAAQLSPATAGRAQEAADRLQRIDENLRVKSGVK